MRHRQRQHGGVPIYIRFTLPSLSPTPAHFFKSHQEREARSQDGRRADLTIATKDTIFRDALEQNIDAVESFYGTTQLMRAVADGNLEAVEAIIRLGADVNRTVRRDSTQFRYGMTALMVAASIGETSIVKTLLRVPGIKLEEKTLHEGLTALMLAARKGHKDCVKALLLVPQIDVNAKSPNDGYSVRFRHI